MSDIKKMARQECLMKEQEWLKGYRSKILDYGLWQLEIRKYAVIVTFAIIFYLVKSVLYPNPDNEGSGFYFLSSALGVVISLGCIIYATLALRGANKFLSPVNDRMEILEREIYGELSIGSAAREHIG